METSSISAILEIIQKMPLATILPVAISNKKNNLVSISLAMQQIERTFVLMQKNADGNLSITNVCKDCGGIGAEREIFKSNRLFVAETYSWRLMR